MKALTCILLAVSLLCIVTAAIIRSDTSERGVFSNDIEEALKNGPYTEPENANVPEGLEWNPDLGEYYNADDYIWDPQTGLYKNKPKVSNDSQISFYNTDQIADLNENDDYISTALAEYYRLYDEFYKDDPMRMASSKKLYCEEAWTALTSLGKSALKDITARILTDPCNAPILMQTIEEIIGKDFNIQYRNTDEWLSAFTDFTKNHAEYAEVYSFLTDQVE